MRMKSIVLAGSLLASVLGAQQRPAAPPVRPRTAAEDMQLFSQVFNQIRINHPDSLEAHRLFMAAIQAMVQATDPFSAVIPAARLEPGKAELWARDRLVRVPVVFDFIGGSAVVHGVAAGTRASRQGILPGDELVRVDGRPMSAESAFELDVMLAGAPGSTVALGFERRRVDGTWMKYERVVRRERIDGVTAVPVAMMVDDTTGYIRITTFAHEDVASELRSAVQRLERDGMRRLVLDLRDNGGGFVDEAAKIAGEFLPARSTVYTSNGRRTSAVDTGRVSNSFFRESRRYPMVLMINAGSASASELVAGALQDHDRATIVGAPSFGKSLMMQYFPMADGSLLYLTIGHVRTPCGRQVQRSYRDLTVRNYYRLAEAERDTAGLPTCRSSSGRVLYGGGGIFPDVRLAPAERPPVWIRRAEELDVPLLWVAGYVTEHEAELGPQARFLSAPRLPASALTTFRALARAQGVSVPTDSSDDAALHRYLVPWVAYAKWGVVAAYQAEAHFDTDIAEAIKHFGVVERAIRR
jgi:carboxyl-terminal processing protease